MYVGRGIFHYLRDSFPNLIRKCPYGLLSPVAASLDVNDSDVMFKMEEKKGRYNSVGFRRFYLDLSLAPEGCDEASAQV